MKIEIRTVTAADVQPFLALKELGLSTDPLSFVASLEEDPCDYPERVRKRLANASVESGDVIIGAFSPQLVGIVAITRHQQAKRRHKADLHGMYIAPEYRGQGLGRVLLVEVLRLATQMEALEEIQLVVATHNRAAAALYRRIGFVDTWTEMRALKVGNQYVDAHHMLLSVNAADRVLSGHDSRIPPDTVPNLTVPTLRAPVAG